MKKVLFGIALILFGVSPALAQRGNRAQAPAHQQAPQQHSQNQSHTQASHNERQPQVNHNEGREERNERRAQEHAQQQRPYQQREWHERAVRHWDGRRFDEHFYGAYFGPRHTFRIGRPYYFDNCYHFRYGGFWFAYYDEWPWDFYDDYYIVQDDDGFYYAYCPHHIGWRVRVVVVIP